MKPTRAILVLTALASLMSGCMVGPNYQTPAAPVTPVSSQSYTAEPLLLSSEQRVHMGLQISAEWWTLYASPQLDQLIKQALAHNLDIAAAKATLAQANDLVAAEQGSLLPQVGLSATSGRQKYGAALFGPANFTIPPFSYDEIGPSASWTPDLFGGTRRGVERQQALAAYQAHQLDAVYVSLTGNVVAQALTIAATQAEISTTQQIIRQDERTLKLMQAAQTGGSGTRTEVLSAQSQLDSDRTLLPPLQQRLSVARHALAILTGAAPADWQTADLSLSQLTLPADLPVSLPSELVRQRPDILAAEANLHAASAAIGVATANLYPKLTLTANFMQEALNPAGLLKVANGAWAVAGTLSAPLFNGGTLSAQKRAAEHGYQAALAQYQQIILQSFGQVADQLQALQHDGERISAQQQAVATATASLDLARRSYAAGNTGVLPILDAERLLAHAQLELSRAQSQRYLDTAQLYVALGGSPLASEGVK